MNLLRVPAAALFVIFLFSCSSEQTGKGEILVAVAANVSDVFKQVAIVYENQTGTKVVLSTGATLNLAEQLRHGAPFDLLVSADVEVPRLLVREGFLIPDSLKVYARGRLTLWSSEVVDPPLKQLKDLTNPKVRRIGIARPEVAPYGRAARETLEARNLWQKLQPKIVYGESVKDVQGFALSGNVEAVFLPISLPVKERGGLFLIEENLHSPLDQAFGIVAVTPYPEKARSFARFILGAEGQAFLEQSGYTFPTGEIP